jgi:hypothetical protein
MSAPPALAELRVWVTFDRATPWQLGVLSGDAWARVMINIPKSCWAPASSTEPALLEYLGAGVEAVVRLTQTRYDTVIPVTVGGPDATPEANFEELAAMLRQHAKKVLEQSYSPSPSPWLVSDLRESVRAPSSGPLFLPRTGGAAAPSSPAPRGRPYRPPSPPPQPAHPQEHLVQQMVRVVRQHVTEHGASPSFQSDALGAKSRAYNFIRSVAAQPGAPDELLEEVRRRLAIPD